MKKLNHMIDLATLKYYKSIVVPLTRFAAIKLTVQILNQSLNYEI